ncbi:PKD domain-containing protein [Lentzea sp. NPDC058450]|uniref:PKD domain-containing protein n=1 Tax=Lentzea sp. NPDC058450 TaxID=3346505 RepID=UPI003657F1E5
MRRLRAVAWGAVGLVGCGVLAAVGAQEQHAVPEVRLHAGSAWVASNRAGHLTLLDGASKEVGVRVPVADPGSKLAVAQQNTTAYAVNRATGALRRVDGATREVSPTESPLPGAAVSLHSAGDSLLLFDGGQGVLSTADPKTLQARGERQVLTPAAAPDLTAVDGAGGLWVVDDATGDLVWFRDGERGSRANAGKPGATRIVATAGTIALLDLDRRTASVLNADGEVSQEIPVPVQPGDSVAVSGLPGEPGLLVSVSTRGQLLTCRFATGCAPPRMLGASELGPAVTTAGHTFVPDYGRGHVWVLRDGASDHLDRQVFDGQTRFELFERDGIVFYNDPESERAGVIGLDGEVHPISKYDPVDPAKGTVKVPAENQPKPPPDTPQPPNPNQPADPTRSPATASVSIGPGPPPQQDVLSIRQTPPNPVRVGAQVTLSLAGSAAATASWDFGDGSTGSGTTTAHAWSRAGTFSVNVRAVLASGRSATATATVVVQDVPAVIVRLQINPQVPLTGAQVSFSAEVTGSPQSWQWTISSGGTVVGSSTQAGFEHTFTLPGTYTVTARTTTNGVVDEQSQQIEVGVPARSVSCGDTITASVRLTSDLTCSDVALSVTSSNVFLDLGGHTVVNSSFSQDDVVVQGVSNVTITNGRLGLLNLNNTDGVTLHKVDGQVPNTTNARNTRINGGRLDAGWLPTEIRSSQVVFTNVELISTTSVACIDGSQCEFINSTVNIGGPTSSSLGCGGVGSVIRIEGGRASLEAVGCETLIIVNVEMMSGIHFGASKLEVHGSTLRFVAFRVAQMSIEGSTFEGVDSNHFQQLEGQRLSGTIKNSTFANRQHIGLHIMADLPTNALLIENNRFIGNGLNPGATGEMCGDPEGIGGLFVCAPAGSNITLSGNTMTNNGGHALFATPGAVKDGGGNRSGGQPCQPAICS